MDNNSNTTRAKLAKLIDDGSCAEAADLTASTILAEFVVIPRADLPEVVEDGNSFCVDGGILSNRATAAERRREALRNVAIAEYLDAREAREAEAAKEAELAARREALAVELGVEVFFDESPRKYEELSPIAQVAVNWLMEAQDKLAEAQEAQA